MRELVEMEPSPRAYSERGDSSLDYPRRVMRHWKYIYGIGFLFCIVAANWAVTRFGMVPVGFGLYATAGTYFAGVSFSLRDFLQDTGGKGSVVLVILLGTLLSAIISPTFAIASGSAFLFSEFADFAVYTPLRKRFWISAVFASNIVGSVIDSVIFLQLAFGNINDIWGQVLGKFWMTLPFIAGVFFLKRKRQNLDLVL